MKDIILTNDLNEIFAIIPDVEDIDRKIILFHGLTAHFYSESEYSINDLDGRVTLVIK